MLSGSLLYLTNRVKLATGVGLALMLWLNIPVVLLTGSIVNEGVPVGLAISHAGDWLLKLLVLTLLLRVDESSR